MAGYCLKLLLPVMVHKSELWPRFTEFTILSILNIMSSEFWPTLHQLPMASTMLRQDRSKDCETTRLFHEKLGKTGTPIGNDRNMFLHDTNQRIWRICCQSTGQSLEMSKKLVSDGYVFWWYICHKFGNSMPCKLQVWGLFDAWQPRPRCHSQSRTKSEWEQQSSLG